MLIYGLDRLGRKQKAKAAATALLGSVPGYRYRPVHAWLSTPEKLATVRQALLDAGLPE